MNNHNTHSVKDTGGIGYIFAFLGLIFFMDKQYAGGVVFLLVGVALLLSAYQKKKKPKGAVPSAPPAAAEDRLHRQALAPDAKKPEKLCEPLDDSAPESAWDGTTFQCEEPESTQKYGYQAEDERRDELKGLYDGGIISLEEYMERLNKLKK